MEMSDVLVQDNSHPMKAISAVDAGGITQGLALSRSMLGDGNKEF